MLYFIPYFFWSNHYISFICLNHKSLNEIMQCTLILVDCCVVLGSLFGGSQDKFWNLLLLFCYISFYPTLSWHVPDVNQTDPTTTITSWFFSQIYSESNCILLFLISRRKMISTAVGDCSPISQIYPYILLYRAIYLWYHSRITHPGWLLYCHISYCSYNWLWVCLALS